MPKPLPVAYALADGFTAAELASPQYATPLAGVIAPMVEHCHALLEAIKRPGFDGGVLLDCTKNGACQMIADFYEVLARYEEGRVPVAAVRPLIDATEALIAEEVRRYPTAADLAHSIGHAFRRSFCLWGRHLATPTLARETYLTKLFAGKDDIYDAICAFNAKIFALTVCPPPETTKSRAKRRGRFYGEKDPTLHETRAQVVAEMRRRKKRNTSLAWNKIALAMRRDSAYAARMRGKTDATWIRYAKSGFSG